MTFSELNLIPQILKALEAEGYTNPTPIQEQAIPLILDKRDILGCAQTGTGKTAAFAIPIIQLMNANKKPHDNIKRIHALILTPTRELAIQIGESFDTYGKNTRLKNVVIFGGVKQASQVKTIQGGIDILIATPGRLLDLLNQKLVDLSHIHYFVLDEADRMLDMGFVNDVKKVLTKLPKEKQSLFFSATMPTEIKKLSDSILNNPAKVEVAPASSTAETINQTIYHVDKNNKRHLLLEVLEDQKIGRSLVFTRTKHGADKVAKDLNIAGIPSAAIHGNKSQNNRQTALKNFKDKKLRVLVATDIAARGIDIDDLTHVINYELPNVPEQYVHRIGRTGRAGASGIAIGFCDSVEKEYLRDIEKIIKMTIPVVEGHNYPLGEDLAKAANPSKNKPKTSTNPNKRNYVAPAENIDYDDVTRPNRDVSFRKPVEREDRFVKDSRPSKFGPKSGGSSFADRKYGDSKPSYGDRAPRSDSRGGSRGESRGGFGGGSRGDSRNDSRGGFGGGSAFGSRGGRDSEGSFVKKTFDRSGSDSSSKFGAERTPRGFQEKKDFGSNSKMSSAGMSKFGAKPGSKSRSDFGPRRPGARGE